MVRGLFIAAWFSMAGAGGLAAAEPLIWIEGESAVQKKVLINPWFDAVAPGELSGGAQVSSFSEPGQAVGTAEYAFETPQAGKYHFWLRANPGTGYTYTLDNGSAVEADLAAMAKKDQDSRRTKGYQPRIFDRTNVALDGKFGGHTMLWADLGELDLTAGKHTLTFSLGGEKGDKRFGAIDCFVLTPGAFQPNGKYKPGEKAEVIELNQEQMWALPTTPDPLDAKAVLDLRGLNEKVAGEHGFIKKSADGNSFVRGDGQPIRFWGGSDYTQRLKEMSAIEHHAQFLAKRGVNIVRLHGAIQPKKEGSKITDVDDKELDEVFKLVAAMKKAGIYVIISPYWGSHSKLLKSWNVPSPGGDSMAALVFFDPTVQSGYKAWVKEIYTRPNPYTGIALKDDPAVAMIQLQNEDSMLFWTMRGVQGEQIKNLRKLYGAWLKEKYGSFEKVQAAWKGFKQDLSDGDDDWANGMPGMYMGWEFTRDAKVKKGGPQGREERLADQLEFIARTMYKFNTEMGAYLHKDLGCQQLINAGNWRTVDQTVVDDAERWSYTANDVIGKNNYYTSFHSGINTGWQILADHIYTDWSAIQRPTFWPMNVKQAAGYPFIIPESLWVPPNKYQAEAPLMVAAQSCLTGLDTFYWFADGVEEWQPPLNIWTYATPVLLGQFPGAALIFRQGLVKEGEPVVIEERSLQNIWDRKVPIISEETSWDPNRDKGDMPVESSIQSTVDPLAFLVGPVMVKYGGDPAKSKVADLAKYIDKEKKIVRSNTGQIETEYGKGLYLVNAPQAQGVAGFLKANGPQKLADVDIACGNEYAAITVVPLDDKPLAQSGKVLVQVGTYCRPTGWKVRPVQIQIGTETKELTSANKILDTGKAPWLVENTDATVTVRNPGLKKAILLDVNGMATDTAVEAKTADGAITVKLPSNTLYLVLTDGK